MTEMKIEALFNDAIIISHQLAKNLYYFNQTNEEVHSIYNHLEEVIDVIKEITHYDDSQRKEFAQKFTKEIQSQLDRYFKSLKRLNVDTAPLEHIIKQYNVTMQDQISKIENAATSINETLENHADAIVATAETIKKRKRSFLWDTMLFVSGTVVGALFLAAYPIAKATTTFHDELLTRDKQIQQLKEHYETNNKMIAFLKKHDITVGTGITDESWNEGSLRFAPMLLFNAQRVGKVDEIKGYKRIVFHKREERN